MKLSKSRIAALFFAIHVPVQYVGGLKLCLWHYSNQPAASTMSPWQSSNTKTCTGSLQL